MGGCHWFNMINIMRRFWMAEADQGMTFWIYG